MKVKQLKVDNYMKLSAIDLKLDGKDVIITGKNEIGKSSLINSLWTVLTGKDIPSEPIQQGKETAEISAVVEREDGSTLICTRKFKRNGKDSLTVTTEDDADYKSPQAFMNKIFGEISFDPHAFVQMQPREQKKYLQGVLKIDMDDLDARKAGLLASKKKIDDEKTSVEMEISKFPEFDKELKLRDLSEVKKLQDEIKKYETDKTLMNDKVLKKNNEIEVKRNQYLRLQDDVSRNERSIISLQQQIDDLKNKNSDSEKELLIIDKDGKALHLEKEQLITESSKLEKPDDSKLETIIKDINDHNDNVKLQQRKKELQEKLIIIETDHEAVKDKIKAVEEERVQILTKAKMPIEGLDFTEDGISFEGLPFTKGQFSTGKMDEIGFRIQLELKPGLRIARIRDWNLLDTDRKNTILRLARENSIQLFIEAVTDDSEIGFEIVELHPDIEPTKSTRKKS